MPRFLIPIYACLLLYLPVEAQQFTKLMDFSPQMGIHPQGGVILAGDYLFGSASEGGLGGGGTIYRLKRDGTRDSVIHQMSSGQSEFTPRGDLFFDGTFLYGMTQEGGSSANGGVAFKVLPDGSGYSVLKTFDDFVGPSSSGRNPIGSFISDGTFLYATTLSGGEYDQGTIFKVRFDGTGFEKLFDFDGYNGLSAWGHLVYDGQFLYGMTAGGGVGWNGVDFGEGTIYKIKTDGTDFSTLLSFDTNTGYRPFGSLLLLSNKLYGTTAYGGVPAIGYGTVFSIELDGSNFAKIKQFESLVMEGGSPSSSLTFDGVYFYGLTLYSGSFGSAVFKIKPDGSDYRLIHTFSGGSNGFHPVADLHFDGSHMFVVTYAGGDSTYGGVYKAFSLSVSTSELSPADFDSCNGIATVNIERGIQPFTYLWSNGQTTPTATGLCTGQYVVTVTDSLGGIDSSHVFVSELPSTSVDGRSKELNLGLFPNPNSGQLFVELRQYQGLDAELNLYDVHGTLLMTMKPRRATEEVDLSAFENGLYLLELRSKGASSFGRVILMHE